MWESGRYEYTKGPRVPGTRVQVTYGYAGYPAAGCRLPARLTKRVDLDHTHTVYNTLCVL